MIIMNRAHFLAVLFYQDRGDAAFYGSEGGTHLHSPIVGVGVG
jgi:hypothetical protein